MVTGNRLDAVRRPRRAHDEGVGGAARAEQEEREAVDLENPADLRDGPVEKLLELHALDERECELREEPVANDARIRDTAIVQSHWKLSLSSRHELRFLGPGPLSPGTPRRPRRSLPGTPRPGESRASPDASSAIARSSRSRPRSFRPCSSRPAGRSRRSSRSCSAWPPSATPRAHASGTKRCSSGSASRVFQKRSAKRFPDAASIASLDLRRRRGARKIPGRRPLGRARTPRTRSAASPARGGTSSTSRAPSRRPVRATRPTRPRRRARGSPALRARAAGTSLPLSGDDAALVKEWTDAFDAYVAVLRFGPAHRAPDEGVGVFRDPEADEVRRARRDGTLAAGSSRGALRPAFARAGARRFHAHGPAQDRAPGHRRDALLHPLPRARQGLVREGPPAEGRERSRESARRAARGLPAGREDLGDAPPAARGGLALGASRSSASTIRWSPAPGTASATTA